MVARLLRLGAWLVVLVGKAVGWLLVWQVGWQAWCVGWKELGGLRRGVLGGINGCLPSWARGCLGNSLSDAITLQAGYLW